MSVLVVKLEFSSSELDQPVDVHLSPDEIRECLIQKGTQEIDLCGSLFGMQKLCVEDDATFIIESYIDLENEISTGKSEGEHHLCIDDARFNIDYYWSNISSSIEITVLDNSYNLTLHTQHNLSVNNYLGGYRRMAKELINACRV